MVMCMVGCDCLVVIMAVGALHGVVTSSSLHLIIPLIIIPIISTSV